MAEPTCYCGHVKDEHGDPDYPGSTVCMIENCECIAFERDPEATANSGVHWMVEREVVGPSFAPALCGKRPKHGWLEERQTLGTCARCISRLPDAERKRLYPVTTSDTSGEVK